MIETPYKIRVKSITTAAKTPERVQLRDTFETPAYATKILIPYIPHYIKVIWECACGSGRIKRVLHPSGFIVWGSDIKDTLAVDELSNFITDNAPFNFDCIITNPPYSIKEQFIEKAFEYDVPFAMLINLDYSQRMCRWIQKGCQKIIPTSRISYLTPFMVKRINDKLGTSYKTIDDIPNDVLYKFSSSQFHSGWLTYGFNLPSSETIVNLSVKDRHDII